MKISSFNRQIDRKLFFSTCRSARITIWSQQGWTYSSYRHTRVFCSFCSISVRLWSFSFPFPLAAYSSYSTHWRNQRKLQVHTGWAFLIKIDTRFHAQGIRWHDAVTKRKKDLQCTWRENTHLFVYAVYFIRNVSGKERERERYHSLPNREMSRLSH